jgi:prolyl-tRNA editing enzyme YbaK/EbsC (Cys-tRNA(Pro) deacylase)
MGAMSHPASRAPSLGRLASVPVSDRPDLVADPVRDALVGWPNSGSVGVAEIDPDLADTAALTEAYGLDLRASGNCVVVAGRRDGVERVAACVVPADSRADVNNLVKRRLDVRKASFLATAEAVERTGMEYGGITPLGIPEEWRVFVDAALLDLPVVVVGSGVRRSKLLLPGAALRDLPRAEVVEDLGRPAGG